MFELAFTNGRSLIRRRSMAIPSNCAKAALRNFNPVLNGAMVFDRRVVRSGIQTSQFFLARIRNPSPYRSPNFEKPNEL